MLLTTELRRLLEQFDYTVECESPLELSNNEGDRATGEFAEMILEHIEVGNSAAKIINQIRDIINEKV